MQAATDLIENGTAFVTIIAEGRVYTIEEFARTIADARDQQERVRKAQT